MRIFFKSPQSNTKQVVPMNNRVSLRRAFVETGDERCPLAGIWSRLPEMDAAADDDPGLSQPARGVLQILGHLWRAQPLRFISMS